MASAEPIRVATYRRRVAASLERVWENVLDWEHLPWVHADSFRSIECLAADANGWRAKLELEPNGGELLIELVRESGRERYVTRTLEGAGAGTEIWTSLSPGDGDWTDIEVEFLVPQIEPARRERVAAFYTDQYRRLWDEDEAMMRQRARELALSDLVADAQPVDLGPLTGLKRRLPLIVEHAGRRWRIVEVAGELVVHACACPHALGPLDGSEVVSGRIRCPWHGYEFDLRSRRSCDGRGLRLREPPRLRVDARTGIATLG